MVTRRPPQRGSVEHSRTPSKREVEGQFARTDKGRKNSGVASADPRVLSGEEDGDATWPLKQGHDRG